MSNIAGGKGPGGLSMAGAVKGAVRGPGGDSGGALVVVEHGAAMPDRCIRCNAKAGGRRVREHFFWIDRDSRERGRFWLLVPKVGMLMRERHWEKHGARATVEVGLCGRHRVLRGLAPVMVLAGGGGVGAVPWVTFGSRAPSPVSALVGFWGGGGVGGGAWVDVGWAVALSFSALGGFWGVGGGSVGGGGGGGGGGGASH